MAAHQKYRTEPGESAVRLRLVGRVENRVKQSKQALKWQTFVEHHGSILGFDWTDNLA